MLSRQMRGRILEMMEAIEAGMRCFLSEKQAAVLSDSMEVLSAVQEVCRREMAPERGGGYCDALTTLGTAFKVLQRDSDDLATAALSRQLVDGLLEEMRREPVKKEIVFLPYKASMWDSLESIWQAAVADAAHCNAYVIPIPYVDLTPEHTAREWHVEKDLFPAYVPTIDFRSVDLEKMHPDVIFIHNPYDDCNYVTSVDAHYYSAQLKKYTDTLVYVPYFNAGDSVGQGVCQAPGVVHADYVIVESDAIKNQYESYYPGGNPPAGKFLSLGSPKYDKIQKGTKGDYPLPEHWQRLVEKKKIILYNTSLTEALQYSDKISAKLRYVFDFFRQRDDVLLWWRPHPLLKATLDAMRPAYAQEYRQLEEQYQKEGWGIYDDTPDVTRTVIWADAYYGDNSSVMYLYQVTGKPILQASMDLTEERGYHPYFVMAACDGESVWFATYGALFQGLYELNLEKSTMAFLGELPGRRHGALRYGAIGQMGNKVILMPAYGEEGVEYDLLRRKFQTIPLPADIGRGQTTASFVAVFREGASLYFIGNTNGVIVEYDSTGEQYRIHRTWASRLPIEKHDLKFYWNSGVKIGRCVYLAVENKSYILVIDLSNMEAALCPLPEEMRLLTLSHDGEDFWLIPLQGNRVARWNPTAARWHRYQIPVREEAYAPFSHSVPFGDRQVFFPLQGTKIFSVRKADGVVQREHELERFGRISVGGIVGAFAQQEGMTYSRWLVYLYQKHSLLVVDAQRGTCQAHPFHFSFAEEWGRYEKSQAYWENNIHREVYGEGLSDFLSLLRRKRPTPAPGQGQAGRRIYAWALRL